MTEINMKIILKMDGEEHELTAAEARRLYEKLGEILNKRTEIVPIFEPVRRPWYEPDPNPYRIVSDNNTAKITI